MQLCCRVKEWYMGWRLLPRRDERALTLAMQSSLASGIVPHPWTEVAHAPLNSLANLALRGLL
jgi:hypothetical protein